MPRFVTLSLNPTIDVSSEADVVRPTHKTRTVHELFDPGGGGINVARVIRELGGDVEAFCLAGGASGGLLDELLAGIGLPRHIIPIAGHTRIALMVHERSTGLEYRFIPSGPTISKDELDVCVETIREARFEYLVASGSVPHGCAPDILVQVGRIAADKGARYILDSSGPGLSETIGCVPVYLVKPSLNEFQGLIGRTLDGAAEVGAEAAKLVAAGKAEVVAVTLGKEGAVVASAEGALCVAPAKVQAYSAVGAGDSFLAAMLLALSEGRGIDDAALFAAAAGGAAVLKPGTQLCKRHDVYRIYDEIKRDPSALERLP